jgi:hypothetical protein
MGAPTSGRGALRPTRTPLDEIGRAERLAPRFGPVREIVREPLSQASSFSGASHERLRVQHEDGRETHLVVKRTDSECDWTCRLTGASTSREVSLLDADELAEVWDVFECPYVAYGESGSSAALLMRDLSAGLFPDVREPIAREAEDRLLGALAALHARFWTRPLASMPWLNTAAGVAGLTAMERATTPGALLPGEPVRSALVNGWAAVLSHAPARVVDWLRIPVAERAAEWDRLPRTLVHGDAKVANFALLEDGVAAFDWAMVGSAPCSLDLGWYLSVNATRLARSKEGVIAEYRSLLERALGTPFDDGAWRPLEDAAVELGARIMLWSKAGALVTRGTPQARAEWEWWMERLS